MYVPVTQQMIYLQPQNNALIKVGTEQSQNNGNKTCQLIQMARIKKKISIYDLSDACGVEPELIASYERGNDVIDKKTLDNIQKFLQMTNK